MFDLALRRATFALAQTTAMPSNPVVDYLCGGSVQQQLARARAAREGAAARAKAEAKRQEAYDQSRREAELEDMRRENDLDPEYLPPRDEFLAR